MPAAPIMPSPDLAATADFYSGLGFEQTGLHFFPSPDHYGLREFAVVDRDGSLLRIGSFISPPASRGPASRPPASAEPR